MFYLCFNTQTIKNGSDTFLIGFAVCSQIMEKNHMPSSNLGIKDLYLLKTAFVNSGAL